MVQLGFFKILKFLDEGKDSQGYQTRVLVESCMVSEWQCVLFLPPHMRKVSTSIDVGSVVFGVADSVIGKGCALYSEDADFSYFWNADVTINKTLTVDKSVTMNDTLTVDKSVTMNDTLDVVKDVTVSTGNIKASVGDVQAGAKAISLVSHTHAVTALPCLPPPPAPQAPIGTVSGSTLPPT